MITKFAKNEDIKTIIEEKHIKTSYIKQFLKENGMIFMSANSKELANQVYPVFFGCSDINNIQDLMMDEKSYRKSSVVAIESTDDKMEESLKDLFIDEVRRYKDSCHDGKYNIETACFNEEGDFTIKLTYNKQLRGRVDLLRSYKQEVNIVLKEIEDDGNLILDIHNQTSSDLKEVKTFLNDIIEYDEQSSSLFDIKKISLELLTQKKKIELFDKLTHKKYSNYILDSIVSTSLKKGEIDYLEDDEVESEILNGINKAILKGDSLRTNKFVQECIRKDFYFTSMQYKYKIKGSTKSFILDIKFAEQEDVLKIDIIQTFDKDVDNKEVQSPFKISEQTKIIEEFQKVVYKIYKELTTQVSVL